MGLADDLERNLDDLYEQTLRMNAEDSFSVAIAATVRRVIRNQEPTLRLDTSRRRSDQGDADATSRQPDAPVAQRDVELA